MKNEKETKQKLLTSAKAEFLEKGYMQASLRNICKNAGVTTGALYFFFEDKRDLFAALVQEPLNQLYEVMNVHYQEEVEQMSTNGQIEKEDIQGDLEAAKLTIHYLYQYYDEFQLLLTKSQGSGFESCIDEFVKITEKQYQCLAEAFVAQNPKKEIDEYLIHWMAHMNIDVFVHMLKHDMTEEEAMKHVEPIVKYMISGWMALFQ